MNLNYANGCYVWDAAGKKYFDFTCGAGTNLLGHAQGDVNKAVIEQIQKGATLSSKTLLETEVEQKLKAIFPFIDNFWFLQTALECSAVAVVAARNLTRRSLILTEFPSSGCDYEPFIGVRTASSYSEIPAAIIIDPMNYSDLKKQTSALRNIREFCSLNKIVFIMNEINTSFRFPSYCLANFLNIEPDILLLGGALANGLPLFTLGTKNVPITEDYFYSSIFPGKLCSLAAARKAIDLLRGPFKLENLWQLGGEWKTAFNLLRPDKIQLYGYPTCGAFGGEPLFIKEFFSKAFYAGYLFSNKWYLNFPLAEKNKITIAAMKDILCQMSV